MLIIPKFLRFHHRRGTVDSKINRALEISRVKKLILMQFCLVNICQVMTFRLYTAYNKQDMIKIDSQTREKSQELLQVLE